MTVELISVKPAAKTGKVVARGRARAPEAGAKLWIQVQFVPEGSDVWAEAYDRLLALLDIV